MKKNKISSFTNARFETYRLGMIELVHAREPQRWRTSGEKLPCSEKPAEKKSFRCFVAVEEIEKLNSSLLTAMYQQFNAKLPRGMIANHIWIYESCLTARHKDAVRLNDVY